MLYRETIPDGASYEIVKIDGDDGPFDNMAPVTAPPDSIFVLGDNRDNSLDSRMPEIGFIPESSVKGRPIVVSGRASGAASASIRTDFGADRALP